jgi:thiol-disulfide isomerase/thioredoxin
MTRMAVLTLALFCCAPAPRHAVSSRSVLATLEAMPDLDGKPVGPSPAKATVVVLFASWCVHCRAELHTLDALRAAHPQLRILGVNYRAHEEYDHRGNASAVRSYVEANAPWLRVVPCDDGLYSQLGSPPKIPTLFVYDGSGALVETFDRRERPEPTADELEPLLHRLGA